MCWMLDGLVSPGSQLYGRQPQVIYFIFANLCPCLLDGVGKENRPGFFQSLPFEFRLLPVAIY